MAVLKLMQESVEEMVERAIASYEPQLIAYAVTILHDHDRARDVVQDTFIRLNRQNPAEMPALKSWLFTVCRNRALDVLRKEKRMNPLEDESLAMMPSEGDNPADSADMNERNAQVQSYLQRLTKNQRDVIILKFQRGMSYKEISVATGLSVGNVGFLIHAGLKRLREVLPEDLLHF